VSTTKKVGLGTTTPSYQLEVIGEIAIPNNNAYRIRDIGGVGRSLLQLNIANQLIYGASGFTGDTLFNAGGGIIGAIYLKPTTGNVGIAASNPTQKLEVNGGVRINTASAKPVTCDSTVRGTFWFDQTGTNDVVYVCARIGGLYSWKIVPLQ
jgi:hypothetical protein